MAIPDQMVENAAFSADSVAFGFSGTPAERTRAIVRRALEALEGNGLITVIPVGDWPTHFIADPPYSGENAPFLVTNRNYTSEEATQDLAVLIAQETSGLYGAIPEQDDLDLARIFVKIINGDARHMMSRSQFEREAQSLIDG